MPYEAWPADDRQAWSRAFTPSPSFDDDFDSEPPGAELLAPSRDALANAYARWLLYLTTHHAETLPWAPADRVSRERVLAYLHKLHGEVALRTLSNYGVRLKRTLELIAPDVDWSWFTPILRRAERKARNRGVIDQPFVHSRKLYAFGIEVMKRAQANTAMQAPARAEEYRIGLMIAFLASRPIRLRNMIELEIGTHLTALPTGFRVFIPRTKTGTELEFPLPANLSPYMARYLADHRPVLATGPYGAAAWHPEQERYLWLARSGAQLPPDTFEHVLALRTMEQFDVRLTPHDFRHCAATTIAENNPEDFHIIRVILGHTKTATSEEYYVHAKRNESARLLQGTVSKMRREAAQSASVGR